MAERRDYVALDWVSGEIEATLGQACQALEAYVADPQDITRLRFCLTYAHQVHGTLRMVEFHGAALYAREIELLAQALLDGELEEKTEALETMMSALLHLPSYLGRVRRARRDLPDLLLPMLNELRALRGDSLLSESALFAPQLDAALPSRQRPPKLCEDEFLQLVKKLRQMFQVAFVGIIRNKQLGQNLDYLARVCQRLHDLSRGKAREPLWKIALAVIEGLSDQSIKPNAAVKSLLKEIDSELKGLLRNGSEYFEQPASPELLKNFLFYVARAQSTSPRIAGIKEEYHLQEALAGNAGDAEGGADLDAMRSVVLALIEEFSGIKDYLDLYTRGEESDISHVRAAIPLIKRVSDTMAVLGLSEPLNILRAQSRILEQLVAQSQSDRGGSPSHGDTLMQVASELIEIEQTLLQNLSRDGNATGGDTVAPHLDEAREIVVQEARHGLEQAKELVIQFVASQWDHSPLEHAPALLGEVRASLDISGFKEPARVLLACQRYLQESVLRNREVPEWQDLDTLADALSSVDYYLERLLEDSQDNCVRVLQLAGDSVARLGYGIDSLDTRTPEEPVKVAAHPADDPGEGTPDWNRMGAGGGRAVEAGSQVEAAGMLQPGAEMPLGKHESPGVVNSAPVAIEEVVEEIMDDDIAEIFVEEVGEVLEAIDELLPRLRADLSDEAALAELRRAFHTLKGSGRMVGALVIGELAWPIESMLNKIMDNVLEATPTQLLLIEKVAAMVPALLNAFEKHLPVNKAYVDLVKSMIDRFNAAQAVELPDPGIIDPALVEPASAHACNESLIKSQSGEPSPLSSTPVLDGEEAFAAHGDSIVQSGRQGETETDTLVPACDSESPGEAGDEEAGIERDAGLSDIFAAEAEGHLAAVLVFLERAESSDQPLAISDELQRALHTLKGSSKMAGVDLIARIATPMEKLVKQLQVAGVPADERILGVLRDSTRIAYLALQQLREGGPCGEFTEVTALLERIDDIARFHTPAAVADRGEERAYLACIGEFMLDAADKLVELQGILERWRESGAVEGDDWLHMVGYPGEIGASASALGLDVISRLSQSWAQAAARLSNTMPEQATIAIFDRARQGLEAMFDRVAADQSIDHGDYSLLDELDAILERPANSSIIPAAADFDVTVEVEREEVGHPENGADDFESVAGDHGETEPGEEPGEGVDESLVPEQVDEEIVEIFLEEARDLLENIEETIHAWLEDRGSRQHLELLQRSLHTLKGGARLTGLRQLGDLSHDCETFLIHADQQGRPCDAAFFAELQRYQDGIVSLVDAFVHRASGGELIEPVAMVSPATVTPGKSPGETEFISIEPSASRETVTAPEPAPAKPSQETVKLPAQLIDDLVNLAGETSINRGRVEEQISDLMFSLAEMDTTIDRMQEQLRRLDIETEAQLIFRQEQVESLGLEEFDPLEMDRYSVLQQLSRSLLESSSDIHEVKRGIFNRSRDIETLLLQQARINTDLQEGLMRSRMVPFSRMVPRLRRIVRQVSSELNKQVNLVLHNTEGEMDRTILERMVPPFEHMLRNSVDHGIEEEAQRLAAGKPAIGTIDIGFHREAGDVLITIADDGRGVDLDAVRAKAVERGLVKEDVELADHEILQFIMQPGFSTAQSVTQISGRGVGMDVVANEIKQLGGAVDIESTAGAGTRFSIRLPFTVSVNRALMVQVCNENYALPLNTIEGIVRVSPFELESYYQPGAPLFEYAGQAYQLRYMGSLIGKRNIPDLHNETMPLPVILVRSGDHSVAVQVDCLLSSREIVVKTLGPQFGAVPGLSGATVLGDGGVVLILDLHAMVRTDYSSVLAREAELGESTLVDSLEHRNLLVMVVDDSVTVRKVTSRFLERNGMDVLLAKDGVDAIRLLQEHTPDLMLLDIEMPRMDGFEVAGRIKHSSRLKNLPIIMITSRTGEKHRERAESIGVDRYLGKPYQEIELLRNIQELAGSVS